MEDLESAAKQLGKPSQKIGSFMFCLYMPVSVFRYMSHIMTVSVFLYMSVSVFRYMLMTTDARLMDSGI